MTQWMAGNGTAGRSPSTMERTTHAAEAMVASARRLAPAAGRAAANAVRHPEAMLQRARHLRMAGPVLRQTMTPLVTGHVDDWRAEYAYSTGLQAFIYGFPYIYNAQIRHRWVTQEPADVSVVPCAGVNQFWHGTRLVDATWRGGSNPSNAALYSWAWVDVGKEPLVLSHPDMGDRYFVFELSAFTSDNFEYVGQRTTGSAAGSFAIVGPGWSGELPDGVRELLPSPTPWVLITGRTMVLGEDDVPAVLKLQKQYDLTSLGRWGKGRGGGPPRRNVYAPGDPATDVLAPFKTLNAMLAENPSPAHHAVLLKQFARVGIGPGLDVEAQPEIVRRELARAAAVGLPLLRKVFASGDWATLINGWRYPGPEAGRYGDDFLWRAAAQSLGAIVANDPVEAVYLLSFSDVDGDAYSPQGRYEMHFPPGELPQVDAFWNLAVYTREDMNLIPNPIDRYSVGDRTEFALDADGALTIFLQPESPGDERLANWLPTSGEHPWYLVLRLYRPHAEIVDATWGCPGLKRVG
jgi:hypothetical protein